MNGLMFRYTHRVPDVSKVIGALVAEMVIDRAEDIENDHIAFRTLGLPHLGVACLERIFLHYGYRRMDRYEFPEKKLAAYWYAPPADHFPRIFISELKVESLSQEAKNIILRYAGKVDRDPLATVDLDDASAVDAFLHASLWEVPHYWEYMALLQESEYAAWVIYNRYYLNHFTISVHNLRPGYDTIPDFNFFLERHGFKLNDAGGKFKMSADGLLWQSSTVSELVEARFADGDIHGIAGSYVEFAERKVLPAYEGLAPALIGRQHRREGFEAANANKIFESTYTSQLLK